LSVEVIEALKVKLVLLPWVVRQGRWRGSSGFSCIRRSGRDYYYFKVKGDDGNLYVLRRDEAGDGWELTMFQRT
jgi:hypothetical protein